ncbi:MAG: UDP-N-acetylmuramoyl-L-alanyl-D-glutamate--2,6-diaminopimelate ligase [Christensenellales bacterium]|jgi:UDP-N-acetylmuramoyl-L-alanyl-D-glutamate--2,6-diaminopimelate ligase
MKLFDLLDGMDATLLGDGAIEIRNISMDSRKVQPGDLFCCISGFKVDGHDFAAQAVEQGAAALVVERRLPLPVPQMIVKDTRAAVALLAAAFYGHPTRYLTLVGVTGTNGKTSTTYMVRSIAEAWGKKAAIMGTTGLRVGDEVIDTGLTTPDPIEMQKYLRHAVDAGAQWMACEVSAHALALRKVRGICFDVGVFTNLTQDHLDDFKTMEAYGKAKQMLFAPGVVRYAVGLMDDPACEMIMENLGSVPLWRTGMTDAADVWAKDLELSPAGSRFTLVTPVGTTPVKLRTPGRFMVMNALSAAAACLSQGVPLKAVREGLESLDHVDGRIQTLPCERGFHIILDYAHTPDALTKILKAVREFTPGRTVALFGCGGDRDRTKRPVMGRIAGELADYTIVTSDNPRTEDPMGIIEQIVSGVQESGGAYEVVENRREAIARAIDIAQPGDTIVLAGKGHETYQQIGHTKYPFDEKVIVAQLLSGR